MAPSTLYSILPPPGIGTRAKARIDLGNRAPIDSCSPMKTQRALLLLGSFWELIRFFLMLLVLAELLGSVAGTGAWVYPWLLMVGSGNLLVAGGGVVLALFPERYASLVAFLRLGKALSVFSFILLILSGAIGVAITQPRMMVLGMAVPRVGMLLGIFVLDLLFLAVLFIWRNPPEPPEPLPTYRENEIGDYH
jgi:hypothetical protein